MSTLAAWSYTEALTVWPITDTDDVGQPIFGDAYLLTCAWQLGGKVIRDNNGNEFVPTAQYWFELELDAAASPSVQDFVKLGDHTELSRPPTDSERIRAKTIWGMEMFGGDEVPDWMVATE